MRDTGGSIQLWRSGYIPPPPPAVLALLILLTQFEIFPWWSKFVTEAPHNIGSRSSWCVLFLSSVSLNVVSCVCPELRQHWASASDKHGTLALGWSNAGPPLVTLAHDYHTIGSMSHAYWELVQALDTKPMLV